MNTKKPLVYFGRLVKSKGVETLIEAIYILFNDRNIHTPPLWVIGGNYDEIRRLKEIPGLHEKITLLQENNLLFWWGQLPHKLLPYILSKCSVFCFTSKYEPGGRTILEAMASGIVVLATPHGFAEEVVEDEKNGFIINDTGAVFLANKLDYILQQPELCKKIGEQAIQTIRERFSQEHFEKKHWSIYEKFLT
jgi:glycosyltransferase involved in cell wall biosynthesis